MIQKTVNPLGQIVSVVDAAGHTSAYAYGPFGKLEQVTGPDGVASTVSYNEAGHRTSLAAPDLGGTLSFQTDSLGEVTQKSDAAGHVTNYTYDKLGRMRTESFAGASGQDAHWYYYTGGNGAGRLKKATKANGFTRTLAYNALGEPTTVTQSYAGTALTLDYGYDTLGRIAAITYPATISGHPLKVAYAYGVNGNLATVTNAHTGTVYWASDQNAAVPAVNAWGEPQAWTLGNGIHVRRDHDRGTGAVTAVMAGPGENSAARVSLAYGYDARGNTASTLHILTGVGRTLTYDGLSRLTQAVIANASGNHTATTGYGPAGNIASRTITSRTGLGTSSTSTTYAYSGSEPHAVTGLSQSTVISEGGIKPEGIPVASFTYNDVGQMTSSGTLSQIQWWRNGRAKQIVGSATTSLAYGAGGALVQKTVAGTTSRYFGKLIVKIGASYRARIVANGRVVALVNINGQGVATTDYLIHDAQGSPTAMLAANGSLVARFAWNAWGELVNPATGIGSDPDAASKEALIGLGYTGHEELWKAGLVHTYARLYNPHLGRWISPDPTVPNLYNGQSLNRYSYVLNNPMTFIDPWGYDIGCGLPNEPRCHISTVHVYGCNWVCQEEAGIMPGGGGILGISGHNRDCLIPGLFGCRGGESRWNFFGRYENHHTKASEKACAKALKTAGEKEAAVQRAVAAMKILLDATFGTNIGPSLLAAIGVRESGFRDINQVGGGPGVGVFQLTPSNFGITAKQANDLTIAAKVAAGYLSSDMTYLSGKFSNFTPPQLLQATAASYNLGRHGISGNPNTIDQGSASTATSNGVGNYGSNVVGLMQCF